MLTKLYRTFETSLITLVLILILLAMIVVFALAVNSLSEAIKNIDHYYEVVGLDKKACLDFGERIESEVEWRDNTILGFGPDDSYGCYLLKE